MQQIAPLVALASISILALYLQVSYIIISGFVQEGIEKGEKRGNDERDVIWVVVESKN